MNTVTLAPRGAHRLVALAVVGVLIAIAFAILTPPTSAQAATVDVSTSCATVDVRLGAHPDKAEVSVVIDGEHQTEGANEGWYLFKSSFTGRYAFEPDAAHRYAVSVNSFAADSGGKDFTPGVGGDYLYEGETTPCTGLKVTAAASSCVSDSRADKQQISLEISKLRPSVTYLTEVLDTAGAVVTHFQFRTAPVVNKTFSGLTAGETYLVRVTDQSNDVLSGATSVTIPGCAGDMDLDTVTTSCVGASAEISAHLAGLVSGRSYTAILTPGSARVAIDGNDGEGALRFSDLDANKTYGVRVEDDNAPRAVRAQVTTPACSAAGSAGGSSNAGSLGGAADADAADAPRSGARASFTPALATFRAVSTSTEIAQASTDAGADTAGPGDEPGSYVASGTAAGDAGPVVAASSVAVPTALWLVPASILIAASLLAFLLWRRRRSSLQN